MIRFLLTSGILGLIVLLFFGFFNRFFFPVSGISQIVRQDADTRRFPIVTGNNLEGDSFTLPADFESPYNVVLLVFTQEQQFDVNTWLPALETLPADAAKVYEVPTLGEFSMPMRMMTDYWMRTGIEDQATREVTITLYLDVQTFIETLEIPDTDSIYTLLVDREGHIYWQTEGPYSESAFQELQAVLEELSA